MDRTVRNIMDAFVQHLAADRPRLLHLYRSGKDLTDRLGQELDFCLDYLRHTNKFHAFLQRRASGGKTDGGSTDNGPADAIFQSDSRALWFKFSYFPARDDIRTHLEAVSRAVEALQALPETGTRLLVEIVVSEGKWAERTIADRIRDIEEHAGIRFEAYAPRLTLTRYNDYGDPLDAHIVMKLHYAEVLP